MLGIAVITRLQHALLAVALPSWDFARKRTTAWSTRQHHDSLRLITCSSRTFRAHSRPSMYLRSSRPCAPDHIAKRCKKADEIVHSISPHHVCLRDEVMAGPFMLWVERGIVICRSETACHPSPAQLRPFVCDAGRRPTGMSS
jgi:hypothetical protein